MILFFRATNQNVIATAVNQELAAEDIQKLCWLYGKATVENEEKLQAFTTIELNNPDLELARDLFVRCFCF